MSLGWKTREYREVKDYWTVRLVDENGLKVFDEIHIRNGYQKDAPFIKLKFLGLKIRSGFQQLFYEIFLGEVLERRNF